MKIGPYEQRNEQLPPTAELEEMRLAVHLQDNLPITSEMHTNSLNSRANGNCVYFCVLEQRAGVCMSIPPLQLQLDMSLLDGDNIVSKSDDSNNDFR